MQKVVLDSEYETHYEYQEDGALIKVINPDQSFSKFFYNDRGIFAGLSHHSFDGRMLRSVRYFDEGPGKVRMIEYPNEQETVLMYDQNGRIAYTHLYGSAPIRIFQEGSTMQILQDDLVRNKFNFLVFCVVYIKQYIGK